MSVKNAAGDVNIAGFIRNEDGCMVRIGNCLEAYDEVRNIDILPGLKAGDSGY